MVNANLSGARLNHYSANSSSSGGTKPNSHGVYSVKGNTSDSWIIDTIGYTMADGSSIRFPDFMGDSGSCHLPRSGVMLDDGEFFLQCLGYIDVNGEANLPNEIVTCTTGTTSYELDEPCTVDNNKVKDVFPVLFYDSTVVPATNAAAYILNNSK